MLACPASSYRSGQAFRQRSSRLQWHRMQRRPKNNLQISTALDFMAATETRSDRALQLAYDVIEHLEKDGLVYRLKVMVVCVC